MDRPAGFSSRSHVSDRRQSRRGDHPRHRCLLSRPAPARGHTDDPVLVAKGKELFDKGVPDRGVPAHMACHGADAARTGDFPRLAGQHAKYVIKQLNYIQSLVRTAPVMHGIVKDLTPDEIRAVAAYVQSK